MEIKRRKNILVTGGAGFIGSHVNKMLCRRGYDTIVLDNLSRGQRSAVCYGTFLEGDLGDRSLLRNIFETVKIDAVMHFAAYIDVGESVRDPAKYYQNNVSKTLNLLTAMREAQVNRCIFSSSAAVYGNPQGEAIPEEHPCLPINPYGETKWMIEKILRDFDRAYGFKSCSLRYFNAAGGDPEGEIKNEQEQITHLIPRILHTLKKEEGFVTIYGTDYPTFDGTCIRDYIHLEDLGMAHIAAMEKLLSGAPSSYYNLGNGKGFSVREVIDSVEEVLGLKVPTIEGKRRPGDPPILVADYTKAERELDWRPRFSLNEMIAHAWNALSLNAFTC